MKKLQDLFNQISEEQVSLPYGIYEGPLVINRSCEINGNDSIIRADEGIVIVVLASRVAIKNLQIEVTGETDDVVSQTALFTAYDDVQLENVTVWGHCVGIYNENPFWFLPKSQLSIIRLYFSVLCIDSDYHFIYTSTILSENICCISYLQQYLGIRQHFSPGNLQYMLAGLLFHILFYS